MTICLGFKNKEQKLKEEKGMNLENNIAKYN